jgi:protein-L-isoaspartate(D-aspartate) O-methyltransferase
VRDEDKGKVYEAQRQHMVQHQLRARGIKDERVLAAMGKVPRHKFLPEELAPAAYEDRALPIGYGQTISQPYMVAVMLEMLDVHSNHKVLEVGAGSGYQAALLAELGKDVYAIEIVEPLARRAQLVLNELGYSNIRLIVGDGTLGYEPEAPYDRIIVAAACPEIPLPLIDQLKETGRIVAPVGRRGIQQCVVGVKRHDRLEITKTIGCAFVPCVGVHGWKRRAW